MARYKCRLLTYLLTWEARPDPGYGRGGKRGDKRGGGFASEALTVFVHVHTKEGGKS